MRAASVPTCTSRFTPAARQAAITALVPSTLTRRNSSHGPKSPSRAAEWKATSAPRAPRSSAPASPRSPRIASAPASRTLASAAEERASARTVQPSAARRRMSAAPTKPEPPVTNAAGTRGHDTERDERDPRAVPAPRAPGTVGVAAVVGGRLHRRPGRGRDGGRLAPRAVAGHRHGRAGGGAAGGDAAGARAALAPLALGGARARDRPPARRARRAPHPDPDGARPARRDGARADRPGAGPRD